MHMQYRARRQDDDDVAVYPGSADDAHMVEAGESLAKAGDLRRSHSTTAALALAQLHNQSHDALFTDPMAMQDGQQHHQLLEQQSLLDRHPWMPVLAATHIVQPLASFTVGSTGQTYRFESGTQPLEFVASLRSVAPLVTLLRAISFKQGLRLTAEDSQTVQAKAYLPKALFREFKCSGQGAGTAGSGGGGIDEQTAPHAAPQTSPVSLQLSIPQGGGELTLMLQESNVVTACNLATYDIETLADLHLNFEEHPVVGKIIMKSDWLKTAFEELDATASDLQLTIAPQHPFMCISATGLAGESTLEYPRDTQVLESFHCSELSTNKYKFSMLQPCMRALAMSNKTSVRVNAKGILSLQFMIQLTTTHFSFVDYIVLPMETTDRTNPDDPMQLHA
ncbi:repair protein Rad1/Rec1/Rad17-domain-containing protein [Entophlyctis helioformis]|nr:repair protein Rad1/Rec1/Rad17-domain-containing protein [Entophlyctis helioformis]